MLTDGLCFVLRLLKHKEKVNPSTPRPEGLGLPSARDFRELSGAAQGEGSACLPVGRD